METPSSAVRKMYGMGMLKKDIAQALHDRESIKVHPATIMRIGDERNDPAWRTGDALIRLAKLLKEERRK